MFRITTKSKYSLFKASLCALFFLILSADAFAKVNSTVNETPQSFIRSFITWYIAQNTDGVTVLEDENIKHYIAPSTLERLQGDIIHGTLPDEIDYFLKVQDFDSEDLLSSLNVYPETTFSDTVIVPVSFNAIEGSLASYLVFYLRKNNTHWEIIKVEKNTI